MVTLSTFNSNAKSFKHVLNIFLDEMNTILMK